MQGRVQRRKRWKATAVGAMGVIALSAGLTGCGNSPAATSSSETGGTTKITVLRSTGTSFEPLYIAQDEGYFKEAGLEVTITAGASDTSTNIPRVVTGEAQLAMTDSPGVVKAVVGGLPIKMVSSIQAAKSDVPVTDGLLVPANSPIKTVSDLEGKTIGTPLLGGLSQLSLQAAVKDAGGDVNKVKFVGLPLTSLADAATTGKVDGILTFASFYQSGLKAGLRAVGNGTNAIPGSPQASFYSSSKWLSENPAAAEKFVTAMGKAMDFANKNPDAVRAIDTKYTEQTPQAIAERVIQPFAPEINTAALDKLSSLMQEVGLTKSAPKAGELVWEKAKTTTK